MLKTETTITTAAQLMKVPGLRARVDETLLAVLQAAREIRRMEDGYADMDFEPTDLLRMCVGDYMISYTLDRKLTVASVVFVEEIKSRSPGCAIVSKTG